MSWYGVFAPGTTPNPIVKRLNSEINKILAAPDMEERFVQLNIGRAPTKTAEEFAQTVRDDMKAWGEIARANNIRLE
jgi:tripartite-type tricarboxylate transporter receptor subunit TctC